ncbi:MAG: RNA polymerase sigma factor [Saprospiraceae bacterium]|nr:RNA polymerase sigma factor [Saprospiraceae bacterium]MCB9325514.1 RNA polymerase sigma factor [Lewinellaceae bacterium]
MDQLVTRIKAGDKSAFAELYDKYAPALYGVVSKIVRSEEIGRDVMQDAFVKIWKHIHSFNPEKGSIFTWMLNISRNTAIDKLRKLKKEGIVEIPNPDSDVGIGKAQQTSIKINNIGLRELVEKLPPEQKLMVDYIYFNGYTQQEVAEALGIPLGTVKTRIRTAVLALRKVFTVILFWI